MLHVTDTDYFLLQVFAGRKILRVYGNPAYRASYGVAYPFEDHLRRGRRYLPAEEQAFNKALASVRIAVEQAFGRAQHLWTYTAFAKGLTAGLQPLAAQFFVAVLLTNCHTCLNGSPAGNRFFVPPPTLEEYLKLDDAQVYEMAAA
jgi:hypothetical protein